MGLESGTYVNDLVTTNPTATDGVTQGDDHLRLIKSTLKTTFPDASKVIYFDKAAQITADDAVTAAEGGTTFVVDTTSTQVDVTLPSLNSGQAGWRARWLKKNSGGNDLVISPLSGTINGSASITISKQYDCVEIYWDGNAYWRVLRQLSDGEVVEAVLGTSAVTTTKIADDAVTLAKLEHGIQGDILYYGASGAPARLGYSTSGYGLITKGTGADPVWEPVGKIVQVVSAVERSTVTISASIPFDNSIPQQTEGSEVLTATITLTNSANKVKISFDAFGGQDANANIAMALFRGETASAIFAKPSFNIGGNQPFSFVYVDTPGSVGPHTYKVRMSEAAAGSLTLNGDGNGTRLFGGAGAISLLLEEIKG
jgi:hypothetical protein